MNKIFSVVWCKALHQLVVTSELATHAKGGTATSAGSRSLPLRAALYAALALAGLASFNASAADNSAAISNIGFENNSLNGWNTGVAGTQSAGTFGSTGVGASVVTGMTNFDSTNGEHPGMHEWTVTPYGSYMASLQAGDSDVDFNSAGTALGLSNASISAISQTMSSSGGGSPTNASYLYQDIQLNAGDSFTMAWQYVSTDYGMYNDVSVTSLVQLGGDNVLAMVNNELSQYALLGATTPGTGNYSTGDYAATGWQIATYSVTTAGTYRLGFLSANLGDTINSPILFIDQAPGATYDKGVPFGPIAPNEGSSAPVTPSGPTTIDQPTNTSDLGSSGGKFDGGTLTVDQPGNVDSDLSVTDNGGVIDQAGKASDFTGKISDDQPGVPGSVTIINTGNGGKVTFSGDNTYTGETSVDTGATLAVAGDGSIASSSGVTNNGTLDISDANNDVDVKSLNGSGNVALGGNDIVITDATGPGATGTIDGTGGVVVKGGTQVLGGNNTYSGGTTADNATVQISDNSNLGAASGTVTLNDGTLHNTGDVDMNRDITLSGTGTFNTDAGTTLTNTGTTSGTGGLVKDGAGALDLAGTVANAGGVTVNDGTLVLSGNNTYTGGTTVNGGTLSVSDDANLGDPSSGLTLNGGTLVATDDITTDRTITVDGGTIAIDPASTLAANGVISGNGPVDQQGGTLVLGGNNTYTGGTSVTDGTVQIGNNANLGDEAGSVSLTDSTLHNTGDVDMHRDVTLSGTGTFNTDAGTTLTNAGTTSGAGGLVKDGEGSLDLTGTVANAGGVTVNDGTLTLSGNNTYTGGTTVNGGTLKIGDDANLGDASNGLTLNGGTLAATDDLTTNRAITVDGGTIAIDPASTLTANGVITGNGAVDQTGGTLVLGNANTYTGGTSVTDGTVQIDNNANLGDEAGGVSLTDSTLHNTGDVDMHRDVTLSGTGTFNTDAGTTLNNAGTTSGSGGLVKDGEGSLNLTGTVANAGGVTVNDGTLSLSGHNTYTGGTTVNGGLLLVSDDANLGDPSSGLTLNGGTLAAMSDITTDRTITVDGGTIAIFPTSTLTANGVISGNGPVDQQGGTLVLGGTNTYTGGTSVSNGTVQIDNNANLGDEAGGVSLTDSTLHNTGDVDMNRDVTLSGTGTLNTDAGTTLTNAGTTSGTGGLVKDGAGSLDLTGTVANAGGVTVNDGTLTLSGNNTYTGGTTVNGGVLFVSDDANLGDASSGLTLNGGVLAAADDITTNRAITVDGGTIAINPSSTLTANGVISGNGPVDQQGGKLVLGGHNTYTGGTNVSSGIVVISDDRNLGDAAGNVVLNNSILETSDNVTTHRDIVLNQNAAIAVDTGKHSVDTGDISGNGNFYKFGDGQLDVSGNLSHTGNTIVTGGKLVLSGTNTYGGDTVVAQGGTLSVSSDANLGHAAGDIVLDNGTLQTTASMSTARDITLSTGGTLDVAAGTTLHDTGAVGGNGALIKNGNGLLDIEGIASHTGGTIVNNGTLVLGGANSYTGGTTVNGGTLKVSADNNLGDSANALVLNGGSFDATGSFTTARDITVAGGSIAVDGAHTLLDNGNVHGTGGLVKNGTGTLDIEGVASHSGGTIVNDGILILGGKNTYTGGNVINGGTLQVSSDANLGNASNNILINGGNLSVTQTMTSARDMVFGANGAAITTANGVTFSAQGDLSGTGGLVKLGGGTLVVSGHNTFTGGTLIDGGVIQIDTGSSLGTGAILLNGGTLRTTQTLGTDQQVLVTGNSGVNVDAGTTTVLSGDITAEAGGGCFIKSGAGKLSLTGKASLGSGTCVQGGTLSANGYLTSTFVQVDKGAWLRGTGVINAPVNVEGTLAAGNSPGTLVVNGTVTMQAGSTLQVDIDGTGTENGAGNYSRVLVGGAGNTFAANGTLSPLLRDITGNASNTYTPALGTTFRIVTADGGVTGAFSALAQPTAGLAANTRFVAFYRTNGGHSIDLRVAPTSYADLLGADAKGNARAVAGALDGALGQQAAVTATDTQTALAYAVTGLNAAQIAPTVTALAGEVHADNAAAARNAGLGMQRDVGDHLGTDIEGADPAHRVWANLTRDGNRSIADHQASGFETGTDRETVGLDVYAENGTVLGVAAVHHDTNVIAHGGSGGIRGNSGLVYAQQTAGSVVLDAMASRGSTDWTTRRADPLGGSQLESRASGKDTMASVGIRMPMQAANGTRIEPYANVTWQKVERDAVAERGTSPSALSVDRLSENGTRALVGVMAGSKANDPLATTLTWRAGIAVGADTGDLLHPTVHNTLAGESFDTAAPGVGRGFVQLNASGTMRLGKETYLYGGLTAEQGSSRSAYGVTAGVRVAF